MKTKIFAAVGLLLMSVFACASPSVDREATSTPRSESATVTATTEPSTPARNEGELNVTVYRNAGGFQTVGAQIEVFAIDQRQSPAASSNENPASFTLAPGAYDVVTKYHHDVHGQMERTERKVIIEPGKKTEVSISFNLGEVELTALRNLGGDLAVGSTFEVYPTVQHEQPLIKIPENPAVFSLTEGTYDILVTYPHETIGALSKWVEDLTVAEGQTVTSTVSFKLGILQITSFKSTGGYQTVGAWIQVYPTNQRAEPLASTDKNPAVFSLPEGNYDVVATYNYGMKGRAPIKASRALDAITVLEGETTEIEVSFGLGELAIVGLQSNGEESGDIRVEVYPTFQHDQPIALFYPDRPEERAHPLEANVYDVHVSAWDGLQARWQEVWLEGVTILEGEVEERIVGPIYE